MENQSQNNGQRRRRNNRSGGGNRNRNRQNNRGSRSGGNRSGGNRNSRNSNRSRRKPEPKPTAWQKFLSAITFGALGKPKKKAKKKPAAKKKQSAATSKPKAAPKKRKPRTEVTSERLYVGNLAYSTTEGELEELFRGVGNVQSAEVVTNSRTQQSKGFAFVEMVSIDEAKRAVEVLDDEEFMGRKLIVSGARSEGPHDSDKGDSAPDDESEPALSESASKTEA